MKLGQEEEIQFGYYSPSQHLGRLQDIVRITNDGLGSEAIGRVDGYGAYGTLPLRGRAEFEVKIVNSCGQSFQVGLMKFKKKNASGCIAHHDLHRFCDIFCEHLIHSCDHCEGDNFGLRLSEDGALEFTVNGESQGIAAENVYTRDTDVYAFVDHYDWDNGAATVITKAGEMIVKHLL